MKKLHFLMLVLTISGILLVGCSSEQNSVSPDFDTNELSLAAVILPTGATITSVKLNINTYIGNNQPINVHRITSDWNETVVTWNSFSGAFDPTIEGSFISTSGWNVVDITPLFNNWTDGTNDNFGILLDQVDMNYPRAIYFSKEFYKDRPFLEVCYTENGVTTCVQTEVIADTYIWENAPDINNGTSDRLYTGWHASYDLEKQSLLKFDISLNPNNNNDDEDDDDCDDHDSDNHDGHDSGNYEDHDSDNHDDHGSDDSGNYEDHDSDNHDDHGSDDSGNYEDHDSDNHDDHGSDDSGNYEDHDSDNDGDHDSDCDKDHDDDKDDDHDGKEKEKKQKDKKDRDDDENDDDDHHDGR